MEKIATAQLPSNTISFLQVHILIKIICYLIHKHDTGINYSSHLYTIMSGAHY